MVRVVLIAVGSRGDAEPFVALADALTAAECSVDLFLQADAQHLVSKNNNKIRTHELPFTQMDFYKYMSGTDGRPPTGAGLTNPRLQFLGIVTDIMGGLVLPCYSHVQQSLSLVDDEPVDAIAVSSLARQLGMELAAQLASPIPTVYLVQLQSLIPTNDFPHYSQIEACIEALVHNKNTNCKENRQTYIELERYQFDFLQAHLKILEDMDEYDSSKALSWDFDKDMVPSLTGHPPSTIDINVWMVNAVSTHLIPPPSDTGSRVCHVGALADQYVPPGFQPPTEVVNFLNKFSSSEAQRPLCFGYGSMPFANLTAIADAVYEARQSAVLVGGSMVEMWNKLSSDPQVMNDKEKFQWIQENTCAIESIPYTWLLPQCSVMFSHGGAGVVHATLRAGIPAAISPMMGDQFFFAQYLEAKGWGVQVSDSLGGLSKTTIVESIQKAYSCKDACRSLAQQMGVETRSGAEILAHQIKKQATTYTE